MSYISLSDKDKKEMLARIGAASIDDLFCCIPEAVRFKKPLDLPAAQSELELVRTIGAVGGKNTYGGHLSFLGGGAYDHFIPTVVDYLSSRGEFVSPYTPYQPEVSQGTLQLIFEFQTLICQLTGLDIANASLYDGATAAAEGRPDGPPGHEPEQGPPGAVPPSAVPRGRPDLHQEPRHRGRRSRVRARRPDRPGRARSRARRQDGRRRLSVAQFLRRRRGPQGPRRRRPRRQGPLRGRRRRGPVPRLSSKRRGSSAPTSSAARPNRSASP